MDTRWRHAGVAALGLAAVATLIATAPPAPGRVLGTTAVVRSVAVTDVVLGVGADEAERRLAWLSADPAARCVEYADPAGSARMVEAYDSGAAVVDGLTWFHAALPGLEAGTAYSYRVGNCAGAWAEPEDFAVPEEGPFSFLLLGDPQVFASSGGSLLGCSYRGGLSLGAVLVAVFLVARAIDDGKQASEAFLQAGRIKGVALVSASSEHCFGVSGYICN